MTYTRKQLIKGMKEYYEDALLEPDEFAESTGTLQEAINTIDYLIKIIEKQSE